MNKFTINAHEIYSYKDVWIMMSQDYLSITRFRYYKYNKKRPYIKIVWDRLTGRFYDNWMISGEDLYNVIIAERPEMKNFISYNKQDD